HTRCLSDWSSDVCSSDLVMRLYRRHIGTHAIGVSGVPDGLDAVASRRGDTVFLHVANIQRTRSVNAAIQIAGQTIRSGRVFEIEIGRASCRERGLRLGVE